MKRLIPAPPSALEHYHISAFPHSLGGERTFRSRNADPDRRHLATRLSRKTILYRDVKAYADRSSGYAIGLLKGAVLPTTVFEEWGLRIICEGDRYFAEYDSGEAAGSRLLKRSITAEQAARAMQSEDGAYHVLLEVDDTC
jgi:hypothetical protein